MKSTQQKPLTCNLETLSNGMVRVTTRQNGRTIFYKEDKVEHVDDLVKHAMYASFGGHRLATGKFDSTYIGGNTPALEVLHRLGLLR